MGRPSRSNRESLYGGLGSQGKSKASAERRSTLILELERGDFDARQAAFAELRALGFEAKAVLEEALPRADSSALPGE